MRAHNRMCVSVSEELVAAISLSRVNKTLLIRFL